MTRTRLLGQRKVLQSVRRELCRVADETYGRCGKHTTLSEGDADHVMPISWGGEDTVGNLQWLCRGCHRVESARTRLGKRALIDPITGYRRRKIASR